MTCFIVAISSFILAGCATVNPAHQQTRVYNPPKSYATNNERDKDPKRDFINIINYYDPKESRDYNPYDEPLTWERWASGIPGLRRIPWWGKADDAQDFYETVEDKLGDYEPLKDNEWLKRHGWKIETSIKPDIMNPEDTRAKLEFRNESDNVVSYPVRALYKIFLFPLKPFTGTAEAQPAIPSE